ncbi:MAG: DNA repair protein RadC [Candidatus Competibacteraceae bacterium]|nr:DNA repair protein RadC [Candidatus Competibacteraceae bacterium]
MLQKEFNFRVLEVRDDEGHYRRATREEIIEAALEEINAQFAQGTLIHSVKDTQQFLQLRMARLEHELFAVLWLDNRHRVIAFEELFRGTIDGAAVYPREILKSALQHNAAACILCHNHPSGMADPSEADKRITEKIKTALSMIEVRTLDHIVVGERTCSFAELGLM